MNYCTDHRTTATARRWWNSIDDAKMTATCTYYEEDDSEVEATVPIKFEVCPTCNGKGSHVNPSIDCNGLSAEDFAEDPDFFTDYMSGMYDQPCNECGGQRVVPICLDEHANERIQAWIDEELEYLAEQAYEMRMGI